LLLISDHYFFVEGIQHIVYISKKMSIYCMMNKLNYKLTDNTTITTEL